MGIPLKQISAPLGSLDAVSSSRSIKPTETVLLGVIAQRFGGRIEWEAKACRITNRPELNAFLKEPVRDGWKIGENYAKIG